MCWDNLRQQTQLAIPSTATTGISFTLLQRNLDAHHFLTSTLIIHDLPELLNVPFQLLQHATIAQSFVSMHIFILR